MLQREITDILSIYWENNSFYNFACGTNPRQSITKTVNKLNMSSISNTTNLYYQHHLVHRCDIALIKY